MKLNLLRSLAKQAYQTADPASSSRAPKLNFAEPMRMSDFFDPDAEKITSGAIFGEAEATPQGGIMVADSLANRSSRNASINAAKKVKQDAANVPAKDRRILKTDVLSLLADPKQYEIFADNKDMRFKQYISGNINEKERGNALAAEALAKLLVSGKYQPQNKNLMSYRGDGIKNKEFKDAPDGSYATGDPRFFVDKYGPEVGIPKPWLRR